MQKSIELACVKDLMQMIFDNIYLKKKRRCICIYIYIYRERERKRERER